MKWERSFCDGKGVEWTGRSWQSDRGRMREYDNDMLGASRRASEWVRGSLIT